MKMVKANDVHIEVASLEDIKEIFTRYKILKIFTCTKYMVVMNLKDCP